MNIDVCTNCNKVGVLGYIPGVCVKCVLAAQPKKRISARYDPSRDPNKKKS